MPGGRFRESYYWDTFWIIKGLLVCSMVDTAKGLVDNLLAFADKYGHVPNGGRCTTISVFRVNQTNRVVGGKSSLATPIGNASVCLFELKGCAGPSEASVACSQRDGVNWSARQHT